MEIVEKKRNSFSDYLKKVITFSFRITLFALLINSIWYIARLQIFERTITLGSFGFIYDIIAFFNLISVFLIYYFLKYLKNKGFEFFYIIIQILSIMYSFLMVGIYINKIYYSISPSVQPYWDSGEWTF